MSATDPRTDAALESFCRPGTPWVPMHPKASWTERMKAALAASDAVDTRVQQLTEALAELVYVMDPPEGCWPQDLSTCDYYRGVGQCTFGCSQEPECQTMHPSEGWPLERARAVLAEVDASQEPAAVSGERAGDAT